MDKKISAIVGVVILVSVFVLGIYEFMLTDKEKPTIYIGEVGEITYTEGEDMSALLVGVTAVDDVDGDVSDSVIVSRITDDGHVYYAAGDKHGNVTESSTYRKITYIRKSNSNSVPDGTNNNNPDTTGANENPETPSQEETTSNVETTAQSDDGRPVIKLRATEATITVGQSFSPLDMVESTYDASGDVSRRIRADGAFDVNKPGDYVINYSVSNPQGQRSDVIQFVLHVKN